MSDREASGVINHEHLSRKTDYLFRISIKCLIRNDKGEVLVVKETDRTWWDLPGGGMDHEESIKEAIARELYEEISLVGDFTYHIITVEEPTFLEHINVWQVRLVFEVVPINMEFSPGEDGDEAIFINPAVLKDSDKPIERKVYSYFQLALKSNDSLEL